VPVPPTRPLAAVLRRRGYELVRASHPERVAGEVLDARLVDAEGEFAVTSAVERPALELEIFEQLVLADAASPTNDAGPRRRGGNGPVDALRRLIGRAEVMRELYALVERVALADTTSVLIQGENGTGKELVANAIHQGSPRRHRGFVVANCSAFNDNLLDSELFGHTRGAFTGATADKAGLFETADQGTFFLDEIGDMSPSLQAKVLRVLQDGSFLRVGDAQLRRVDVRVIAATNRDLAAMVQTGEFREDLFYRINAITLRVPPLRERRDDIPLLVETFLARHSPTNRKRLSQACEERMKAYSWPGNVRELENEIERLVVLAGESTLIEPELLTPRIRDASPRPAPINPESLPEAVEALERAMIAAALRKHRGNKSRAAQALQVSRRNLIRLVRKYRLGPDEPSDAAAHEDGDELGAERRPSDDDER
jgi:two-component system, NtrC family, response regulator HupR/HoxA